MKKRIVCIWMSLLMVFSLAACGNTNGDTEVQNHDHDHESQNLQNAEVVLKVALSERDGEIHYESVERFADEVEERTNGKIAVEIIGGGKLGEGKDLIHGMAHGEEQADIVITKLSDFTDIDARMDISSLPFLFPNEDEAWQFMNGSIQSEIEQTLLGKNVRILTHYAGDFHALTTKSQVTNAKELQDLSFVSYDESQDNKSMLALGARVTVFEKKAIMQALEQEQCDGYVGTFSSIQSSRLYQTQEFVVMTNHCYEGVAVAISEMTWNRLSEEYREIVEEAAKHSAYIDRDATQQALNEAENRIKSSGVQILYPDTKSFREKLDTMIRNTYTQYGTLLDRVMMEYYSK